MSWDNLKIIRNIINSNSISSDDLNKEEYDITCAEAKLCDGENKIKGELTITNKRIVFSAKNREDISLELDEIELVKSNKHIFSIKDKLTIVGKNKENVFSLNYSEDWVSLIEQLLKTNTKG
ncbi:hypothetical protein EC396_03180 [Lutibacter sp. HS1-25]|uniref:hypothetical protein n=1 Tax=Lutibacter sp. HS1-25 TaxID=2485000 RepID=UPI0010107DA1|nr:hypothetical protein [Lutibacter sp. HS1-25]RXP62735.1 hypothetical protein EC396_03180 [Lutibacter sp. HS1-25]